MGQFRRIFSILVVVEACSLSLAVPYGHRSPAAVDVGSQLALSPRDQLIIETASRRGMDPEAVAQLLRTKEPVVRVKVEANGDIKTTTYKLDADGTISLQSVIEKKPVRRFHSESFPASVPFGEGFNSPTGTVTRTFIDSDGSKVTQTYSVGNAKTTSTFENDDDSDWFSPNTPSWVHSDFPSQVHRVNAPKDVGQTNYQKTVSTYIGPDGKKRVVESFSSGSGLHPEPEHNIPTNSWPSFNTPTFSQPWQPETDGWTVVKGNPDVETTTTNKFPSTWNFHQKPAIDTNFHQRPFRPNVPNSPAFEDFPDIEDEIASTPKTTVKKPTVNQMPSQPKTTEHLPSLEEFLNTQYVQVSTPKSTPTPVTKHQPKANEEFPSLETSTSKNNQQRPSIQNQPIMPKGTTPLPSLEEFLNSQNTTPLPTLEEFLKSQRIPASTPAKPVTIRVEDLPVTQVVYKSKPTETNVHTITRTHITKGKPSLDKLDPETVEMLQNAGISLDDITNIDGDTITKTRTEPDGRTITTTFKVRSLPPKQTTYEQVRPVAPTVIEHKTATKLSPVSEYLSKLGLTVSDIFAQNGEYTQTLIDEDGQVLTATFVLSRPASESQNSQQKPKKKPQK